MKGNILIILLYGYFNIYCEYFRPFVCFDCGKAFTQITNHSNHRRLHTGER